MGELEDLYKDGLQRRETHTPNYGGGCDGDGGDYYVESKSSKEIFADNSYLYGFKYLSPPYFGNRNWNAEDKKFQDDQNKFDPIRMGTLTYPTLLLHWDGFSIRVAFQLQEIWYDHFELQTNARKYDDKEGGSTFQRGIWVVWGVGSEKRNVGHSETKEGTR